MGGRAGRLGSHQRGQRRHRRGLTLNLRLEGYQTFVVNDGETAWRRIIGDAHDAHRPRGSFAHDLAAMAALEGQKSPPPLDFAVIMGFPRRLDVPTPRR